MCRVTRFAALRGWFYRRSCLIIAFKYGRSPMVGILRKALEANDLIKLVPRFLHDMGVEHRAKKKVSMSAVV